MSALRLAATQTSLALAGRWRLLRTPGARAGAWAGLIIGLGLWSAAAGLGVTLTDLAATEGGGPARAWLAGLDGGATTLARTAAVSVCALVLIAPITRGGVGTIFNPAATPWARVRLAAYTDPLVAHAASLPVAGQLIALTALASATNPYDHAHRVGAIALAAGTWIVLGTVSVGATWAWTRPQARPGLALGAAVVLAVAATPLGAGAVLGWFTPAFAPAAWAILVALGAGAVWAGARIASTTPPARTTARTIAPSRAPRTPTGAIWTLVAKTIWRTPTIRTPLVAFAALGTAAMVTTGANPTSAAALLVVCALVHALAWPANAAALTSGATKALGAVPGWSRLAPRVLLAHAALTPALAVAGLGVLGALVHAWPPAQAGLIITATVIGSTGMATTALAHAALAPVRTDLAHGDPALPPARTIAVLAGLGATWGAATIATTTGALPAGPALATGAGLACALGALVLAAHTRPRLTATLLTL